MDGKLSEMEKGISTKIQGYVSTPVDKAITADISKVKEKVNREVSHLEGRIHG